MNYRVKKISIFTGFLMISPFVVAQQQSEEKVSQIEELVVTGRAGGAQITQFESSVSITTFDESRLRESGASSAAALLAQVPGVWAEASGGEAGNNVFVRGIPATGQYLYSKISVDGLPIFEEIGGFPPIDGLFKLDETIARLEVVRGGTSSIFASNAPGGIFNYITKKGTQETEGVVKFEIGDYNYARGDLFLSGAINDKWTYALGGFYRESDGVRDPGFTADDGGQFRIALTRELEKGDFTINAHYIDDSNIFYLPFPLANVGNGDAQALTGQNGNFDTNVSRDARFSTFIRPFDGTIVDADVADGIHNEATNIGTEFNWELGGGWNISNKNRYTSGDSTLNSHIIIGLIGGDPGNTDYQDFLDGQLNSLRELNPEVSRVEAVLSDGKPYTGILPGRDTRIVGQGGFFYWETFVKSFTNDFQIFKEFDTAVGVHNFTAGVYISRYDFARQQQINGFLQEIDNTPRTVDINGVDASGNVVATGTINGFNNLGLQYFGFESENEVNALYLSDEWAITDSLRIDLGFRYEDQQLEGRVFTPVTFRQTDSQINSLGTALPSTADDEILFRGEASNRFDESYDEVSYSIGANYVLKEWISMYGRFTDSFRTPTVEDLARAAQGLPNQRAIDDAVGELPVNEIQQIEAGFKIASDHVDAFVTFFHSEFENATSNDPITGPNNNIEILSANLSSTTYGVEAEIGVGPFYGFSANLKTTIQDLEVDNYTVINATPEQAAAAQSVQGNRPRRIPDFSFTFRPKYEFTVGESLGSIYMNVFYAGERFEDYGNQISLPSYTSLGMGATYDLANGISFTFTGNNLTNELGLTEGNPRDLGAITFGQSQTSNFGRPILGRHFRFSVAYSF